MKSSNQQSFDFDEPQLPPATTQDSVFFAPIPSNDRDLIVLQIARDLDTLRQEETFIVPDRAFYETRIAALRKLLQ